jgi:hypothetical protein
VFFLKKSFQPGAHGEHGEKEIEMSLFCDDRDLLVWEAGIFSEPGMAHLALLSEAEVNVAGTALTSAGAILSKIAAGMVGVLKEGAGSPPKSTAVVFTEVVSSTAATVSVPRVAGDDPAAPWIQGDVKLSVVSFRPVIEAVGREVVALLGLEGQSAGMENVLGLRPAAIFGTLAAIYRAIGPSADSDKKLALYTRLYQIARRAIAGMVDLDGDGHAETLVFAGTTALERV